MGDDTSHILRVEHRRELQRVVVLNRSRKCSLLILKYVEVFAVSPQMKTGFQR